MTEEGWEVQVRPMADLTKVMAVIPGFNSLSFSGELSGLGGGSVGIPLDDPILGAPLPLGLTSTRQVEVDGVFQDAVTRVNVRQPRITVPPGAQVGTLELGSTDQFIRFAIDGGTGGDHSQGKVYLWYTDDSNHLLADFTRDAPFGEQMQLFLVSGGVETRIDAQFYPNPSFFAAFADWTTGHIFITTGHDLGFYGMMAVVVGSSAPWDTFTPGTKIKYDYSGKGSINSSPSVTREGYPASFLAYGRPQSDLGLGTFTALSQTWNDLRDDASSGAKTSFEIVDGAFQPAWNPLADFTPAIATVDCAASDGSWQVEVHNAIAGSAFTTSGVVLRCGSGQSRVTVTLSTSGSSRVDVRANNSDGSNATITGLILTDGTVWTEGDVLRVTMAGNDFSVYQNTTKVAQFICALNSTSTVHGIFCDIVAGPPEYMTPEEAGGYGYSLAGQQARPRIMRPTFVGKSLVPIVVSPTNLLDDENVWQVWDGSSLRHEWLAETIDETVVVEDQTKVVQVAGRGTGLVLEWGKVLPKNWPTPTTDTFIFKTKAVMAVFLELLGVCQTRDTLSFVTCSFTATHDSAGVPWGDIGDIDVQAGDDLLQILTRFTGLISADWRMLPGFILDVRQTYGTHRETTIEFHPGGDVQQQGRKRDRTHIANVIAVKGADGKYSQALDTASIGRYFRREEYVEAGDAKNPGQRNLVATSILRQFKSEVTGFTVQVVVDQPGKSMFDDYTFGDWVGVKSDDDYMSGAYRAVALSVTVDNTAKVTGEITLESKKDIAIRRLKALIDKMGGSTASGQTSTSIPISAQIPVNDFQGLQDVDLTGLKVGDEVRWNGTLWVPYTPPNPNEELARLIDVDVTGKINGSALVWNTLRSRWIPGSVTSGGSSSDVLTTKGDLLTRSVSAAIRVGVGTDGQYLVADSSTASGLRWATLGAFLTPLTTKGDLMVRGNTDPIRLPVGTDGKVLTADSGAAGGVSWQDVAATGSSFSARTTASYTTATLAAGGTETGTIAMAKGYRLLRVQTSAAARVRIYGTTAERTADASRAWGVDPVAGSGLILDYLTTGAVTQDLSPTVDGFSMEAVPVTAIPIAITATGATAVTVTLTYLRTE